METKKELTKDEMISKEIKRLNDIYKGIDKKKRKVAEGLIAEAAFMRITLNDLKSQINESGTVNDMCQGKYYIKCESPAVKTYNTMIQRYTNIIDKLVGYLPKDQLIVKDESDGFDEFVSGREDI